MKNDIQAECNKKQGVVSSLRFKSATKKKRKFLAIEIPVDYYNTMKQRAKESNLSLTKWALVKMGIIKIEIH